MTHNADTSSSKQKQLSALVFHY